MSTLRNTLIGNGLFSTIAGTTTVLFAAGLADYMSVSETLLRLVGVGTTLFGLSILWEVRTVPTRPGFARLVIAADIVWVIGALVVVVAPGTMANKWLLAVVSTVVAVFAIMQTRGVARVSPDRPRTLTTEITIASSPGHVWEQLTDFDSYADWNPFMVEASGEAAIGAELSIRMQPPGGTAMTFTPTVTQVTEQERLEWLGSLIVPGLFDGRHRFELEPTDGGTRMTHSEEFTGFLVPLLWRSLDTKTRAGFEAMNQALKSKTERALRNSV